MKAVIFHGTENIRIDQVADHVSTVIRWACCGVEFDASASNGRR